MSLRASLRTLLIAAFPLLVALGCKQGPGEPCETDDDCGSGYKCSCNVERSGLRGVCVAEGEPNDCPDVELPDAGPDTGVPRVDAGRDAGGATETDAGVDGGSDDVDAGTDAGSEDVDAGSDAGSGEDDAGT